MTLVNVLQKVLEHYFGADVRPAPDRLYFSMDRTPYSLVEFDPASFVALPISVDPHPSLETEDRRDIK